MVDRDGQMPQDLEDKKVGLLVYRERGITLTCWAPLGALRLFQSR